MSKPILSPRGARWSCRSCGSCCRSFELGPIAASIVDGLQERQVEHSWPPAADQPWARTRLGPDGRTGFFFCYRGDGCVFLRDDQLCAIHGLFGAEAKPSFCREFPFHVVEEPRGLVVVVRAACAGYHHSFRDGEPLADQVDEIVDLPRLVEPRRFAPERVAVLPDLEVPLATWLDLEDQVLTRLEEEVVGPTQAVALARSQIARELGLQLPEPDPHRYLMAGAAVVEALRLVMSHAASQPDPTAPPHRIRVAREAAHHLEAARAGLPSPAALSSESRAYLDLVLRGDLLAKRWTSSGSVAAGLGVFLVGVVLTRAALSGAEGAVEPGAVASVHTPWDKLTAHPAIQSLLDQASPALVDLFLHAAR